MIVAELAGEPFRGILSDKVFRRARARILEGATHDLLHLALVKIDAWTEAGHGGRMKGRGAG